MKTTWKIVFALFLLLPLAGCEEECNSRSNEDEFMSPEEHSVHILFFDSLGRSLTPIMVEGFTFDREEHSELEHGSAWAISARGDLAMTVLSVNIMNTMPYLLHFYGEEEARLFEAVPEVINAGDCDESAFFRFYYKGELVHTCTIGELKDGFRLNI